MDEYDQQGNEPERGEQASKLQPRIWVGSLADYNAGVLHGEWLDAWQGPEQLGAAIAELLGRSPTPGAEEWAIFDADDFGGLRVEEHENLATVAAIARGLREHGPAFAAWADLTDKDPERLASFEQAFLGRFDSLTAYAEHLFEELGYRQELERLLPDYLRTYVRLDAEAFGRDLHMGSDLLVATATDGGVWLFDGSP